MKGLITKKNIQRINYGGLIMKNENVYGAGRNTITRWVVWAGLVCATTLEVNAQWYFDVGPLYRGDMEITVRGGSRAADSGVTAARDGTSGAMPSLGGGNLLTDDGTAQILREFDNGYVGPSGWGWANNDGVTQFFAYEVPGQYDALGDTLTYQLTLGDDTASQRRTQTRTRSESIPWSESRRIDGFGVIGTLGYELREEESWSLRAQARFGWLPGIRENFRGRPAFRQTVEHSVYEASVRREETYVYTYDTLGNPAFPAAPYAMADPSAVGPLIADVPTTISRTSRSDETSDRLISRSMHTALSSVDLSVETQMFTFQLGPRLMWQALERIALLVQPAVTMNLLDVTLRRHETFRRSNGDVIASWSDHSDRQAWRLGAGVQAGAQVALSERWNLTAAGGYEWVNKYHLSAGPDRIHLDLSGYQLELALGRPF